MEETDVQLDRKGLATFFGVYPDTITKWRTRHPTFPRPDGHIGGSAWWWRSTVARWDSTRVKKGAPTIARSE